MPDNRKKLTTAQLGSADNDAGYKPQLPLLNPLEDAKVPIPIRTRKTGKVVSDLNSKTLVVEEVRRVPHPRYHRMITKRKKFYAHDEHELGRLGDIVEIESCRPRSALKRWELVQIIAHGDFKNMVWKTLPMNLVAELDTEIENLGTPHTLRFSLAPSQTTLFPEELTRSGRPVKIEIRFSGDRIEFDKASIELIYYPRTKHSTSEAVGVSVSTPPSPVSNPGLPSIEASVLYDQTLVNVKRFQIDPTILKSRS